MQKRLILYECESRLKFNTISVRLSGQVLHDMEKRSYFPDAAAEDDHIPLQLTS